jgi:hypothetical protein
MLEREGVRNMADANMVALHEHPDDVESIRVVRPPVTVDPD